MSAFANECDWSVSASSVSASPGEFSVRMPPTNTDPKIPAHSSPTSTISASTVLPRAKGSVRVPTRRN